MTTEVYTQEGIKEVPTATEFIPADDVPGVNRTGEPMVKRLHATDDGGVLVGSHAQAQSGVENHVYVCDECGHDEPTENGIAHHLEHEHRN